jgi:hypothetical protein
MPWIGLIAFQPRPTFFPKLELVILATVPLTTKAAQPFTGVDKYGPPSFFFSRRSVVGVHPTRVGRVILHLGSWCRGRLRWDGPRTFRCGIRWSRDVGIGLRSLEAMMRRLFS